jgi:hypothetical protein
LGGARDFRVDGRSGFRLKLEGQLISEAWKMDKPSQTLGQHQADAIDEAHPLSETPHLSARHSSIATPNQTGKDNLPTFSCRQ